MSGPELQSKQKLDEVHYFLKRVTEEKEPEIVMHNLSAFQNASYGVMQIILYDFAEKLGLGVTRDTDRFDINKFESLAVKSGNQNAKRFVTWWRQKDNELTAKNWVWRIRRFIVHRKNPKLHVDKKTVEVSPFRRNITEKHVAAYLTSRRAMMVIGPPGVGGRTVELKTVKEFTIEESSHEEIVKTCRELDGTLMAIVDEAEKTFWT